MTASGAQDLEIPSSTPTRTPAWPVPMSWPLTLLRSSSPTNCLPTGLLSNLGRTHSWRSSETSERDVPLTTTQVGTRRARPAAVAGARIEVFRHGGGCTHLLDNPVPRVPLDNPLRIEHTVLLATEHDEARRVLTQPLVLFRRHFESGRTRFIGALAHPTRQHARKLVRLVDLVDALIDLAEQGFVLPYAPLELFSPSRCRHCSHNLLHRSSWFRTAGEGPLSTRTGRAGEAREEGAPARSPLGSSQSSTESRARRIGLRRLQVCNQPHKWSWTAGGEGATRTSSSRRALMSSPSSAK